MRPKITDEYRYYLAIPGLVEKVVILIRQDFDATRLEAMNAFYASPTYAELEKKESGLWKWKPRQLYQDFLQTTNRTTTQNNTLFAEMNTYTHTIVAKNPGNKLLRVLDLLRRRKETEQQRLQNILVADDNLIIDSESPLPRELLSSSYPELPSQEEIKNDPRYVAAIGHKE